MAADFINQILNNFLKLSKFYIKVKQIKDSPLHSLPDTSVLEITSEKPIPPYIETSDSRFIKIALKHNLKINIDSKSITPYDAIMLAGALDIKNSSLTESHLLRQANYYALTYYYEIKKNPSLSAFMLHRCGLTQKAEEEIKKYEDEQSKIILARIYREIGDIKKTLEILSNIKSKELEVEKNISYAWLHLLAKKPENSYKIFNYYRNTRNPSYLYQEIIFGLALSMIEINNQDITSPVKLMNEAKTIDGFLNLEITKKLMKIYMDMNDYLKAFEMLNFIYCSEYDLNLTEQIIKMSQKISNNTSLIHDLALVMPENAMKLLDEIKIPSNPELVTEDKSEKIIESILKPEDITKISRQSPQKTQSDDLRIDLTSKIQSAEGTDTVSEKAFQFSKDLEKEFSKKIYFNLEGIDDLERKTRLTAMSEISEYELIKTFESAGYFLLYLIRERFKAKIRIEKNLDLWTASARITNSYGLELTTYPVARIWRLRWDAVKPPHGYLREYIEYINSFMNISQQPYYGKIAVIKKSKSSDHKVFDAQIEHRKILEVAKDIEETSYLSPNSSLLPKFEKELRRYFKPGIPPTVDGWKILRCFAHIFLEMIIKDFSPSWYCVEKNDGLWSFELPGKTYIFPVGKIYKAVLTGESIEEYYQILRKNFKKV